MEVFILQSQDQVNKFYDDNFATMSFIIKNSGLLHHYLDDLFNESLEEVWKMNSRGQIISNLKSFFLNHIFKKNALNLAEKERKRKNTDISENLSPVFSVGTSNIIESKIALEHIEHILSLMQPTCRKIIKYYLEGYSNEEIGQFMNLQKNSVASYKSKCLDKFEELTLTYL
ncbi:MAG: sigma-70 family RNA polymerase sigma factor [Saprospiraceae bacterium]|nr:sigma-70 family RNA polymerase sigma factor [Candidatus Vicinibacter affinis]